MSKQTLPIDKLSSLSQDISDHPLFQKLKNVISDNIRGWLQSKIPLDQTTRQCQYCLSVSGLYLHRAHVGPLLTNMVGSTLMYTWNVYTGCGHRPNKMDENDPLVRLIKEECIYMLKRQHQNKHIVRIEAACHQCNKYFENMPYDFHDWLKSLPKEERAREFESYKLMREQQERFLKYKTEQDNTNIYASSKRMTITDHFSRSNKRRRVDYDEDIDSMSSSSSSVISPSNNRPVSPPVQNRPVSLPVQNRPVSPPVQNRPVSLPVQNRPVSPPIQNRPVAPPIQNRPVAPPIQMVTSYIANNISPTSSQCASVDSNETSSTNRSHQDQNIVLLSDSELYKFLNALRHNNTSTNALQFIYRRLTNDEPDPSWNRINLFKECKQIIGERTIQRRQELLDEFVREKCVRFNDANNIDMTTLEPGTFYTDTSKQMVTGCKILELHRAYKKWLKTKCHHELYNLRQQCKDKHCKGANHPVECCWRFKTHMASKLGRTLSEKPLRSLWYSHEYQYYKGIALTKTNE